jgi:hypothetical protein
MVALVLGKGLQRCEIGPGARLGIALAPADIGAANRRHVPQFLFLAAIFEQRRPEH